MALASSDRMQMRRKTTAESSFGETPSSPAMTNFNVTGANLNSGKTTVNSATLRSDRMLSDIIQTGFQANGDFGCEWRYGEYDWALESLFGSTFSANTLKMGTTPISYLIEQEFSDITQFKYQTGVRISQMDLNITARQVITAQFTFLAKQQFNDDATIASGVNTSAGTNPIMNASTNVGSILENGVTIAAPLRSITCSINGNLRSQDQIGSLAIAGIGDGTFTVGGRLEAYFQDATIYDKVIAHTTTSISFVTTDDNGNTYTFTFPKVKLTGDPNAAGQNQDVILGLDWAAFYDSNTGTMAEINRSTYAG